MSQSKKSNHSKKTKETSHPKDLQRNPFNAKTPLLAIRRFFTEREEIWLSFLFAFGAMLCAYMLFGVWPRGEKSVLCLDLNAQYVYYHVYMRDAIFGPDSILYSWSRNFSGEFVGIIGYYLFSPFNFLVWVFPMSMVTEGLLLMILVKIGMIAVTMSIYLSVWRGFSKHIALMFSVMYALTSYNIVQTMNPMWLDGVMMLPLIVMGIEALLKQGRFKLLIFALAYSFITNFYIGFMLGIFAAMYFVYYALTSRRYTKANFILIAKRTGLFAAASGISVMLSAFILLPVYASLSLGKFDFSVPDYSMQASFEMFDMTRKLFLNSYDTVRMEGLPFIFVGTLALLLIPAYFACSRIRRTRRIGGIILMLALIYSMVITPIDMLWHGGQMPNWLPYRYSFILGFLILVFSAETLQHIRKVSRYTVGASAIIFGALLVYWQIADTFHPDLGAEGRDLFPFRDTVIPALVMLAIFTLIVILAKKKLPKYNVISMILLAIVCIEMTFNAVEGLKGQDVDITYSDRDSWNSMVFTREVTDRLNAEMTARGEFYRMEKNFMRSANDPMALRMRGVTHSSSMLNANALHVMNGFGYAARSHSARYWGATPLTDDLFAFRYVLSSNASYSQRHHSSIKSSDNIDVYVNENVLPMAYLVNPRVRDFRLVDADVFGNQTRLLTDMLGDLQESPVFVRMTWVDKRPENLAHKMIGDYHAYERTAERTNAHIQYDFVADADGDVFMYFPTNFERRLNLWLQRRDPRGREFDPPVQFLGQMYETDHHHIQHLGYFREGEAFMLTVSLQPEGTVMYFRDQIFMRLDSGRLDTDIERIHQMNENTNFTAINDRHLQITTNHSEEMFLFTSIPNEPGWRAYVNGRRVPIEGVVNWTADEPVPTGRLEGVREFFRQMFNIGEKDDKGRRVPTVIEMQSVEHSGFIGFLVPAGENVIELRFFPNHMPFGIALTFAGIAGFVLLIVVTGMLRKRGQPELAAADIDGEIRLDAEDDNDLTLRLDSSEPRSAVEEILAEIGIDMDEDANRSKSRKAKSRETAVRAAIVEVDDYDGYDEDYVFDDEADES
jgi:uncharacterized membrane protein YfhO